MVCACGEIHMEIDKERMLALAADGKIGPSVYCHCSYCRRAHSATQYEVCYIPTEILSITRGNELISKTIKFADGHINQFGEDNMTYRRFCTNCGTRLYNEMSAEARPQLAAV